MGNVPGPPHADLAGARRSQRQVGQALAPRLPRIECTGRSQRQDGQILVPDDPLMDGGTPIPSHPGSRAPEEANGKMGKPPARLSRDPPAPDEANGGMGDLEPAVRSGHRQAWGEGGGRAGEMRDSPGVRPPLVPTPRVPDGPPVPEPGSPGLPRRGVRPGLAGRVAPQLGPYLGDRPDWADPRGPSRTDAGPGLQSRVYEPLRGKPGEPGWDYAAYQPVRGGWGRGGPVDAPRSVVSPVRCSSP